MLIKLVNLLLANRADRRAVTAIEYALIAALIAVVIIAAVSILGGQISTTFNSVSSEL
jgi:pilus assembly protein Flp/PilA